MNVLKRKITATGTLIASTLMVALNVTAEMATMEMACHVQVRNKILERGHTFKK